MKKNKRFRRGDFPISLSWETSYEVKMKESSCCEQIFVQNTYRSGFQRRRKWGFLKISAGSRTLIAAISSFVKASTPCLLSSSVYIQHTTFAIHLWYITCIFCRLLFLASGSRNITVSSDMKISMYHAPRALHANAGPSYAL